jgi:hypothetical protein
MSQRLVVSALALLVISGCGILKKKTPEAAPSAAVVASAAPTPPAPPATPEPVAPVAPVAAAEPPLDEATIPAPQDFEDEAFTKVTAANFKAELAKLNKEIVATK